MPKHTSPMRLEKSLVDKASVVGRKMHRSINDQIEYWADIGERVSKMVSPNSLDQVMAGLARLHVEPILAAPVDPEAVFNTLAGDRESGALAEALSAGRVRYQASRSHPGQLERIDERGQVQVGQFKGGRFVAMDEGQHR